MNLLLYSINGGGEIYKVCYLSGSTERIMLVMNCVGAVPSVDNLLSPLWCLDVDRGRQKANTIKLLPSAWV